MPLQLVVAIPAFVCSFLSFLASSTFVVFYLIFPPERHFRQALIVNLLVADLINSANNTVSGAIALSRHASSEPLGPGPACTANGYIGQFSVQAIDFNILIISVAVLLTVRQSRIVIAPPWWQVIVMCAIPWMPPVVTSNIALKLGLYGPVSGNWCWIQAKHFKMRYLLTHGWRIAIFVSTIAIYTYVYIYLKRMYGQLHLSTTTNCTGHETETEMQKVSHSTPPSRSRHVGKSMVMPDRESDEQLILPAASNMAKWPDKDISTSKYPPSSIAEIRHVVLATPAAEKARERRTALRKMLLLNGYPILYILLWMPGMANRIAEAFGPSPTWLRVAQASTQLVGLANAITYAYSEQLRGRIRGRRRRRLVS